MRALTLVCCAGLLGCGLAAVRPGQVVVDGDTTFTTREQHAIDVRVALAFRGHRGTGAATLRGFTLDEARRSPLVNIAVGRAWLAIVATLSDDPSAAYEAALDGIAELGTHYRSAGHVIDDTGNSLSLAEMAAARGDLATAARGCSEVLRARVELYRLAFRDSVD